MPLHMPFLELALPHPTSSKVLELQIQNCLHRRRPKTKRQRNIQPYNEESKKERERVKEMAAFKEREKMKEMAAFKDFQNLQNTKTHENFLEGDYHVTLEAKLENFLVPNESTVNLAITMMNDLMLQINYFGPLDVPAEGSNLL
ncbi:hypothetical protein RGQ29_026525 [Quercus rubra]|uniref:Uncharacterized protein n=1 Tax=Quercus rubra TaxID=3512 RepID=A0AAN7ELM2_QUERU|nr:hypothetical protein RGQ29_026525 [Quercus rubra]